MNIVEGQFLVEGDKIVFHITYPTEQQLDETPDRAVGVLLWQVWLRLFDISRSGGPIEPSLSKLLFEWVYARRPLSRKAAIRLAQLEHHEWEQNMILMWAGKRGRPIVLRKAAIAALFRREYLGKRWLDVTRRVCPCGDSHGDPNKVFAACQPKLEAEVRILKRLLRACNIDFPPKAPSTS